MTTSSSRFGVRLPTVWWVGPPGLFTYLNGITSQLPSGTPHHAVAPAAVRHLRQNQNFRFILHRHIIIIIMNVRIPSWAVLLLVVASSEAFLNVPSTSSSKNSRILPSSSSSNNKQAKIPFQSTTNEFRSRNDVSSLQLSAVPVAGAIAGALTGGFFAGGLHAIAGTYCRDWSEFNRIVETRRYRRSSPRGLSSLWTRAFVSLFVMVDLYYCRSRPFGSLVAEMLWSKMVQGW